MTTFPDIQVGNATWYEALGVFPLFLNTSTGTDYLLSDEAISAGSVAVEEVSQKGSVPNLLVTNKGNSHVLFLEGEELRGAKQNRILNTSVLIAAHSKTPIPVSCVEQGRWRYRTEHFVMEGSHSSSKLRRFLKGSVSNSLKAGRGYSSDQEAVWQEVSRQMRSLGSASSTHAMADTYLAHAPKLAEYRDRLRYVEGASGLAVAVGEKIVALDFFDKPATCQKVWDRLLSGVVMDALEVENVQRQAGRKDVEELLSRLRGSSWAPTPAVGEGQEFRYDSGPETHASALVYGGTVLHGSVVQAS